MMSLCRDSELMGLHSSEQAPLEKISSRWWPQMKSDAFTHCQHCQICHSSKPRPVMTAEARTELHERPFRDLFMGTVGPVAPNSEGCSRIAHVECISIVGQSQ